MKKQDVIVCSLLVILVSSTFPIVAASDVPNVLLPTNYITMRAVYGSDSWFDMTLSNITGTFDITNGVYPGWCIQKNIEMTQNVNHRVALYSSYDPSMPDDFKSENWDKINYIINHKKGDRESIQKAIWNYTDNENCSSDPDAQAMVDDAEQNGLGFVPQSGDIIAIPIDGYNVQHSFLELIVPSSSSSEPSQPSTPGNYPPTADGTAGEPYQGIVNAIITFDGSRSYDRDGQIVFWQWIFGDGTNGSGSVVQHFYDTPGTYLVTLTVIDNKGARDTYETVAIISFGNNPPSKPVISGPSTGKVNVTYTYSVISTDPDGDVLLYVIDWGDGSNHTSEPFQSGNTISATHLWNAPGFYFVQVYAQDSTNASSDSSTIMVAIDVLYVRNLGYLINADNIESYDRFYSNNTQDFTIVKLESPGIYSIDTNGDGSFDTQYNILTDTLSEYPEQLETEYMILLLGLCIAILLIIFISFFLKRRHKKE